jgi:two-component system osmolarity sensor histidine kinase EnvZ
MLNAKGRYTRLIIIVVAPILLLEGVVAFIFMERHWDQVTRRLSEATARNIGAVIDLYESGLQGSSRLEELAYRRFGLKLTVMGSGELPAAGQPKPLFDLLDHALSEEIRTHVGRPFWIDTVGGMASVEIRVKVKDVVLRFTAPRRLAYASNSHIFLIWMLGTSMVLLAVAILSLRHQVRSLLGPGNTAAGRA